MGNLWIGTLVFIVAYQVASDLIASGISWRETLFTIVLGHFPAMVFTMVLGHFGMKHSLTYPILRKTVFGSKDAVVPSLVRGILDCLWFGVQTWIGGQAVNAVLTVSLPFWNRLGFEGLFISFLIFWLMNVYIVGSGPGTVQKLEKFTAPVLILPSSIVTIWGVYTADWNTSGLFSEPSTQGNPNADLWRLFFPTLSSMIVFDGGTALSIADFTRSYKTQKARVVGQPAGVPVTTVFATFVGIYGTAGVSLTFHGVTQEPAVPMSKFDNPAIVITLSPFITMVVLTTNVTADLVPSANVLATLFAKKISYKEAAPIAAMLALFTQSWSVLASVYDLICNTCGFLGALLGSTSGLYLTSYLLKHRTHVDMVDPYRGDGGRCYYKGGWNTAIIAVFLTAMAVIIAEKYITPLNFLSDSAYATGSVEAELLYYIYLKVQNKRNEVNENDEDNHQTRHDCVAG